MSAQFERDFDKALSSRHTADYSDVEIDRVVLMSLSADKRSVAITEQCDMCFGTTANREQFERLIFAMKELLDQMQP